MPSLEKVLAASYSYVYIECVRISLGPSSSSSNFISLKKFSDPAFQNTQECNFSFELHFPHLFEGCFGLWIKMLEVYETFSPQIETQHREIFRNTITTFLFRNLIFLLFGIWVKIVGLFETFWLRIFSQHRKIYRNAMVCGTDLDVFFVELVYKNKKETYFASNKNEKKNGAWHIFTKYPWCLLVSVLKSHTFFASINCSQKVFTQEILQANACK